MNPALTPRMVRCPVCKGDSIYSSTNPYRPFCSERCKSFDFGAWANEEFKVAADTPPDEAPPKHAGLQ